MTVVDPTGSYLEVVADGGNNLIAKAALSMQNDAKRNPLVLSFALNAPTTNLEIRIHVTTRTRLRVSHYELIQLSPEPGPARVTA